MGKRCSTKNPCSYPRANWWKQSIGVDWFNRSSGGDTPEEVQGLHLLANSSDPLGRYVLLYFSEGVYHSDLSAAVAADFSLVFSQNAGTGTNATIASVKKSDNTDLVGGEDVIRVNITLTGTFSGVETITISPSSTTAIRSYSVDTTSLTYNTNTILLSKTYSANYQAVLTYMVDTYGLNETVPAAEYREIEDQWVIDTADVWATSDRIFRFSKYDSLAYALLNWKDPGNGSPTIGGTLPWAKGTGFTFGSGYLLTGFVPSTDGVNFTLNVAGIFHATENDVQNNLQFDYGCAHSDGNTAKLIGINPRLTDNTCSIGLNTGVGSTVTGITTTANSTFLNDRTAGPGASHDLYYNGVLHDPTNFTANALPDRELVINARMLPNGTVGGISSRGVSCLIIGSTMGTHAATLNTAEATFRSANAAVATTKQLTTDDLTALTTDDLTELYTD